MIPEIFLYQKVRGNFLRKIFQEERPLSKDQFDILMYIRFFANSDGWVMNRPLKEFMNYTIWIKRHEVWHNVMYSLIEKELIQMRGRQAVGRKKKEKIKLNPEGNSGVLIEFKLTAKGSMLIREFDESADAYFEAHLYNRKADALNEDRDIFKLADGK